MPVWKNDSARIPAWRASWSEFLRRRCSQRILIVTDRFGSFDPNDSFGLTELIRVLEGAGDVPAAVPAVVTKKSTAEGFSFKNASPAVTVANYDQIWLFGFAPGPASTDGDYIAVVTQFMRDGGGVFATGDHSDIGQPLCGALPRVRKMREWSAIPMLGPNRIDTLNDPGADAITTIPDQSDAFPQRTYPLLDATGAPHPLLRSPQGPINVLPDHPHESECYAPRGAGLTGNFTAGGSTFPEFPQLNGRDHGPELVTISMSASLNIDKGPVAPRCFGAVSAYDGHLIDDGRIVCDSTWHHFVNMNLNSANPYGRSGLYEGTPPAPTAAYKQIQRYFANIADYLTPKNRRWCWLFDLVVVELFEYPLLEEIVTLPPIPPRFPDFPDWPRAVAVGQLFHSSIDRKYGAGTFQTLADDMLEIAGIKEQARAVMHQGLRKALLADRLANSDKDRQDDGAYDDAVGIAELRHGIVGEVVERIREELPANPDALAEVGEKLHETVPRLVAKVVATAASIGVKHLRLTCEQDASRLESLL